MEAAYGPSKIYFMKISSEYVQTTSLQKIITSTCMRLKIQKEQ